VPAVAAATGPPAAWFLAGTMLDPAVMFASVPAPACWATVAYDWLAGPAPADLSTAAGRLAGQLTRACPRPLILVGHSAGGVLAMLAQLRVPGRVHGLLLVNTGAHVAGQRNADLPGRVRDSFGPDLAKITCPATPATGRRQPATARSWSRPRSD
jgi:pimeloyl-ACP methyl ester carboxylesterase